MKINYSLAGGAKESHSEPIYCVAWSKDRHVIIEEQHQEQQQQQDRVAVSSGEMNKSDVVSNSSVVVVDDDDSNDENKFKKDNNRITIQKYCRYMATCGSNHLTLYEVYEKDHQSKPTTTNNNGEGTNKSQSVLGSKAGFRARQVYIDVDEEEIFYSCLFVGHGVGSGYGFGPTIECHSKDSADEVNNTRDTTSAQNKNATSKVFDLNQNDGPQLCCVGGRRGIIKVIDTVRTTLLLTLSGHGNEIYDMSVCPHDPWLLLSASKDESLRLWNIQNSQCIAIFAGHQGHRDAVLSVDWHPLGKQFVSSGMDETIKIWSLEGDQIRKAMDADRCQDGTFRTVYEQLPLFSTAMIHTNYVDCVQFVGDLILSKSTTNTIALWKPDLSSPDSTNDKSSTTISKLNDKFLHLCDYDCTDCDVWYVRFGTNSNCTMLAVGNGLGDVRLFHIDSRRYYNLVNLHCSATIRQVSFTPDDQSIIVVCDDSTIWKWDIVV